MTVKQIAKNARRLVDTNGPADAYGIAVANGRNPSRVAWLRVAIYIAENF